MCHFQTFLPLVDNVGLWKQKLQKPVEFLGDLRLDFQDYAKLKTVRRWSDVAGLAGVNQSHRTREAVQAWAELQDCQQVKYANSQLSYCHEVLQTFVEIEGYFVKFGMNGISQLVFFVCLQLGLDVKSCQKQNYLSERNINKILL